MDDRDGRKGTRSAQLIMSWLHSQSCPLFLSTWGQLFWLIWLAPVSSSPNDLWCSPNRCCENGVQVVWILENTTGSCDDKREWSSWMTKDGRHVGIRTKFGSNAQLGIFFNFFIRHYFILIVGVALVWSSLFVNIIFILKFLQYNLNIKGINIFFLTQQNSDCIYKE